MGILKGRKKTKKSKSKKSKGRKSSLGERISEGVSSLSGGGRGGGGGGRRRRGPAYWANRVLVEKLKKKYWKLKYGGR